MRGYPCSLTQVFDTQAGFECFWQGLKRLAIPKASALYHGRTRRFRVDYPCCDLSQAQAIEALTTLALHLEQQALALEALVDSDTYLRRFEE